MAYTKHILFTFLMMISAFAWSSAGDKGVDYIPFEVIGGMIVMQMEVDGISGNYILDSGAEGIIINRPAQKSDVIFTTVGGDRKGERGAGDVKIGNISHNQIELWYVDLQSIVSRLKTPIAGLIGTSVMKAHDVMIDYNLGQIRFLDKVDVSLEVSPTRRVVILPFTTHFEHLPVVEAKIEGKSVKLGFDSGANATVLDLGVSSSNHLVDINLEGLEVRDASFFQSDINNLIDDTGRKLDGILSVSALQANQVIISYDRSKIYLLYDQIFSMN